MDKERFRELVTEAISALPDEFRRRLENVDVVAVDWPSPQQMASVGLKRGQMLLGLYQGVPQTKRGRGYGMVAPDKISIFQKPIEARCHSEAEITAEIGRVVRHEIAHHFGIGDDRLRELERGKD
ncbi:MAG: metallopeptidase family protein [Dehalococcoidales bacterium]|nr:metallopeptidase family protein [Dehalococcoidales bacterium]